MAQPTDRVQVMKQESAGGGGNPADIDPFYAEVTINETQDGISSAGVFLQKQGGPADETVCLWREGDTVFYKDSFVPTASAPLNSKYDFLLENEPDYPATTYTPTRTGGLVTKEEWRRADTTLLKSIDYTRTGGLVTQEVRKVFDTDGTTILAQLTVAYTRTGGIVTSQSRTRDT